MCGRYSIGKSASELASELEASLATDAIEPRFNVAPTQDAPMLVALPDRRLGLARFGWSLTGRKGILLNARSETAGSNGLFRAGLERRRALIPADGFYEWRALGEGKKAPRQAYFLHDHGAILTFAGLYYVEKKPVEKKPVDEKPVDEKPVDEKQVDEKQVDEKQVDEKQVDEKRVEIDEKPREGEAHKKASFVILTTAASPTIAVVHDRMPIIVPAQLRSAWLDAKNPPGPLLELLKRRDPELALREVGPAVGSVANDDPSLRDPVHQ